MRSARSKLRRGFTFVEVMIVVAIIGVLAALAVSGWNRAAVKRDIHNAVSDLESAVRTARNLASLAGGAIGGGVDRLENCVGHPSYPLPGNTDNISILIDGPNKTMVAPVRLIDDGSGTGKLITDCVTIDLSTFNSDGEAAELLVGSLDTTVLTLAFSQLGRVYIPPGAPVIAPEQWNVGVRTVSDEVGLEEGFQILESGVLCRRKIKGLAVNTPVACDVN